jgi:predicted amidohydrolase YtcJ
MPDSERQRASSPPALALVNGRIHTRDARRPWVDAVLVHEGRVVALGSSAELRKRAGKGATLVDAKGLLVIPLRPEGKLAPGEVADLAVVDVVHLSGEPPPTFEEQSIVLVIEEGRVILDRHSLVRTDLT